MDDLRDQIKAWTDATATQDECEPIRTEDIIDRARPGSGRRSGRSLVPPLLVAAAVVAVVAVAAVIAWPSLTSRRVLTTGPGHDVENGSFMHGPGSPILAGLRVQPGSALVAQPFPDLPSPDGGTLWRTLVKVTGGPETVFAAYVNALKMAGITIVVSDCSTIESLGETGLPPHGLKCSASGEASDPKSALTDAYLDLVSPLPGNDDFATSLSLNLMIRGANTPPTTLSQLGRYYQALPTTPTIPTTMPSTSTLPKGLLSSPGPAHLPTTGERIAPKWMDPGIDLHVVEGSTLLAPAAPLDGGSLGWVTVARLTRDPGEVMSAYLHQGRHDTIQEDDAIVNGHRVLWGWWNAPGGAELHLTAMQDSTGTWLLRINVSND